MQNKYVFVSVLLVGMLCLGILFTNGYEYIEQGQKEDNQEITLVTSFYPMYVATLNIVDGIDGVKLENLSEPQTGCLHDYQLTPADMKLLSQADAFIVNGGGIESFLSDVAEEYPELVQINTAENLTLLEEENAHVWMSVSRYMEQVKVIAQNLETLDPDHKNLYEANANAYLEQLEELVAEEEEMKAYTEGKKVILFHEAFAYLADDLDMKVTYTMDLDEERQVSAGEVADVLAEIQENGISHIFAEELYAKEMGDTVMAESSVEMLYLDPLTRGDYEKDRYISMMKKNLEAIREAYQS